MFRDIDIYCQVLFLFLFSSAAAWGAIPSTVSSAIPLDKLPFVSSTPDFDYTVDLKGWVQCASKLKDCRPSQFSLPNPAQITAIKMGINFSGGKKANGFLYTQEDIDALLQNTYQTYIIHGWKKGTCLVTIEANANPKTYVSGYPLSEDFVKQMFPITKVSCTFNKDELHILSTSAQQIENESESRDFSMDAKAGEILARACHPVKN